MTQGLIQRACEWVQNSPDELFYSHDRHLLAAAPHFGLEGLDLL